MWVQGDFTSQNDRRVFSEGSSANNNPLFTLGTDNTATTPSATVFVRNDAGAGTVITGRKSTRPVFDNTWHHLVWTDANGKGKLYVDGVLDETDYNYTRSTLTLNQTSLGAVLRAVAGNWFLGNLDEVATWKRVLSWTEIQSIMTTGIPTPISAIPPSVTAQPLARTAGVFAGDTVTFSVQASGTVPLTFEWYRNDTKIDAGLNPSAATDTLRLTNVVAGDSGSTFYVKVSNSAGTDTSSTVALNVANHTPVTTGEVLRLDVGLTGSPNIMSGFEEFTLGINGTNYQGVGVAFSGLDASLADRNRIAGAMVPNNPPIMSQAQLYNDFVFAASTVDGTGMRITISRLAPNTPHGLTVWSFDPQSVGARFADWRETTVVDAPVDIAVGYTFDGSIQPVNDYDQTFGAILTSSPTGTLQIDGVKSGGTSFGAFVNAIRLVANPTIQIVQSELVGPDLRLTIHTQFPGQAIVIEERAEVDAGIWGPSATAVLETHGPQVIATIPAPGTKMFYRAALVP